jgi:hypothetical protein
MKKRLIAIGAIIAAIPLAALAQFFGPQWVIDTTQAAHAAQEIAQAGQELSILEQEIQMAEANIRFFPQNVKARWMSLMQPFYHPNTANIFGETRGWANAIGSLAPAGSYTQAWQTSTISPNVSPLLSQYQVGQTSKMAQLASVDIADSAGPVAMQTIGSVRGNQPADQAALQALEQSCADDANNAEVQQQNCAVAAQLFTAQTQETANALLVSELEQQVYNTKRQRDQDAEQVRADSAWLNVHATQNWHFGQSLGDPNQ